MVSVLNNSSFHQGHGDFPKDKRKRWGDLEGSSEEEDEYFRPEQRYSNNNSKKEWSNWKSAGPGGITPDYNKRVARTTVYGALKIFVGGLPASCVTGDLVKYFSQFGPLADCVVMFDKDNKHRGFGFVTFIREDDKTNVLRNYKEHVINRKWVEVKECVSKNDIDRMKILRDEANKLFENGEQQARLADAVRQRKGRPLVGPKKQQPRRKKNIKESADEGMQFITPPSQDKPLLQEMTSPRDFDVSVEKQNVGNYVYQDRPDYAYRIYTLARSNNLSQSLIGQIGESNQSHFLAPGLSSRIAYSANPFDDSPMISPIITPIGTRPGTPVAPSSPVYGPIITPIGTPPGTPMTLSPRHCC